MKIPLAVFLILLLLGCGGSDADTSRTNESKSAENSSPKTPEPTIQTRARPEVKKPGHPVIIEIKFISPARTNTDLELVARLEIPDNETLFDYRWFINDNEIFDAKTNVLPSRFFKSGDWIHCRVKAVRSELESGLAKSKYIMIQGRSPVLELPPIGAFDVPGRFQYQIKAADPDADEFLDLESTLSYELVSPADAGISLNTETGEMVWNLTEDIIKKLGNKIDIKFKVNKKGAPSVSASITLNFVPPQDRERTGDQAGNTEE